MSFSVPWSVVAAMEELRMERERTVDVQGRGEVHICSLSVTTIVFCVVLVAADKRLFEVGRQPGQLLGCKILPTHSVSQLFLYVGSKADSR